VADKVIEIKGFDELLKALKDAPEKVMPFLQKAMTISVRAVQARLAQYPPSTAANQPGRINADGDPMGYYERGRGWWYPVLERSTLGKQLGVRFGAETAARAMKRNKVKGVASVAGYKLRNGGESELLGRSWAVQVVEGEASITGIVGNNTSYADYVQGGRQAAIHGANGWITLDKALELAQEDIDKAFSDAADEYIKQFGG
jgi:hypothetical protein